MRSDHCSLRGFFAPALMKISLLVFAVWFAVIAATQSYAVEPGTASACAAELATLMARWNAIGFAQPWKPSQAIVEGQHGVTTNGSQYNEMIYEIRAAATDCKDGRDLDARRRIQSVQSHLDVIRLR